MAIGISEGEFWKLNIRKLRPYLLAENIKRERESQMMWLMGVYNKRAFEVVLSNAFGKKGSKPLEYFKEPIRITPYTEEEIAERNRKELQHTIEVLNKWKGTKG